MPRSTDARTMLSVAWLVSLGLCLVIGGPLTRIDPRDVLERGPDSLNEMFREVEMLMEDTQQILEEAVDQIATESAKSFLTPLDMHVTYHNKSAHHQEMTGDWNNVDHVALCVRYKYNLVFLHRPCSVNWNTDKVVQTTPRYPSLDNSCPNWEAELLREHPMALNRKDCMVDEDCGDLRFCLYEVDKSKCLPCIPTDMPCTKDEECCPEEMCVWGQCTVNTTRGSEGTICQLQSDCRADLCCAFQRELLFPVCNPRPGLGEACQSHPNLLTDLLAWDQDGPGDHCPCVEGLHCQPHGRVSACGE